MGGRPDLHTPSQPPPVDRTVGPSGLAAVTPFVAIFMLAVTIVVIGLGLIGGWVGFAIAVALTIFGVLLLSRYVQRIAWTSKSPERLRRGLAGMNEDFANSDDVHDEPSAHDIPPDNPLHRELERHSSEGRAHRR